ncbi:MAG: oligosaccharide flippase family protein [Campylobacterales bacterium]|nr:oligosaccharide flippase family protein [Campylobacterales bacterium]
MTGTTIAQAVPILIMPILTRLWSPEEFGVFATYMAFVAILGVISAGRLDMALMLPSKNEDAVRILIIGLALSLTFVLLLYPIIFSFDKVLPVWGFTVETWHYLVPLGVFLYASYAMMIAWHNRNKNYKLMSQSRVIQSTSISFSQAFIGLIAKFNFGLIFSDLIGRLLSIILIIRGTGLLSLKLKMSKTKKIALLKRYRKFPLIEAPASFINVSSHQLPFIVLPIIFSPVIVGHYFLVFRVLMMPASLVGTAVLEVFKNRAQEDFKRTGSCRPIFIKTGLALFSIGVFPVVVLILFAPTLFSFVFGEEWREAGEYAQVLAPLALAQFVSAPLSYVLVFREKLFLDLKLQIVFLSLVVVALWFASELMSISTAIWFLMISGVVFYLMQIFFSYRHSTAQI